MDERQFAEALESEEDKRKRHERKLREARAIELCETERAAVDVVCVTQVKIHTSQTSANLIS